MKPGGKKSSKLPCLVVSRAPLKVILFTFLALTLYVTLSMVSSGAHLSVIVDMSIKMKGNVIRALSTFTNISEGTINGSWTFGNIGIQKPIPRENMPFPGASARPVHKLKTLKFNVIDDTATFQKTSGNEIETFQQIKSKAENLSTHKTITKNVSATGIHSTNNFAFGPSDSDANDEKESVSYGNLNDVDKFGNSINSKNKERKQSCDACFTHNFMYVIQNENICRKLSPDQTIELLMLITTTHRNARARMALRSTWLTYTRNNTANVRYAFLLGEITDPMYKRAVLEENKLYHDIIKEDFLDSYKNLTYKSIMAFKWASSKCAHAKYVMKTDDDVYVNVPNLIRVLSGPLHEKLNHTLIGACSTLAKPIRNMRSKWYASWANYPEKFYPGFCSGTGYATSMNVARQIYNISPNVPFFHLEDVYVSLCVNKLGYKLQRIPGFNAGRQKLDPCLYKGDSMITSHQLSPLMMKLVWNKTCTKGNNADKNSAFNKTSA